MKNSKGAKVGDTIATASGGGLDWGKITEVRVSALGNTSFSVVREDSTTFTFVPQKSYSWDLIKEIA